MHPQKSTPRTSLSFACQTAQPPYRRHKLGALPYLLAAAFSIHAWGIALAQDINGNPPVSKNEDTKIKLHFHIEAMSQNAGQIKLESAKSVQLSSSIYTWYDGLMAHQATQAGQWFKSKAHEIQEAHVNRIYRTPVFRPTNISRYKIYYHVPDGYAVYYRVLGSQTPFRKGAILESDVFNVSAYEVITLPENSSGALPGKMTNINSGDGELRISLGFLSNGQSAGYLDFLHEAKQLVSISDDDQGAVDAIFGRGLGAADLHAVSISDDVEIITQPIPQHGTLTHGIYQPATLGMRQIIAPQAIVNVIKDGAFLTIQYFNPNQRLARITQENSPYTGSTVVYGEGKGPYAMNGSPFVSYRISMDISSATQDHAPGVAFPLGSNESIDYAYTIQRTEGATTEESVITQRHLYLAIAGQPNFAWCSKCGGWGDMNTGCGGCDGIGFNTCDSCGGEGDGYARCGGCRGSGNLNGCPYPNCDECAGQCPDCMGEGYIYDLKGCEDCGGWGSKTCSSCSEFYSECPSCGGEGILEFLVPGKVYPCGQLLEVSSNGVNNSSCSYSYISDRPFPEGDVISPFKYGKGISRDSEVSITTGDSASKMHYEGAFPAFTPAIVTAKQNNTIVEKGRFTTTTEVLASIQEGDQNLKTTFGYYRYGRADPKHDLYHGRMKWRKDNNGGWTMFDYATDLASLGRMTKVVRPWLDQAMPDDLPSSSSATGYRVATTSYTHDWAGMKRLPAEVAETANGHQIARTVNTYAASTANGQPLWVATTSVYPSSGGNPLTTISKIYEGLVVTSWLRGLPYSATSADGSKESVAYHRGTVDEQGIFTPNPSGKGFRSVVLKGRVSGGSQISSYGETGHVVTIDPIHMIPNVSVAEVTIRNERAMTVRTETLLYATNGNWILIDSADMKYDIAGNLVRRKKFNGTIYEAEYTSANGASESYGAINFDNNGTRTGRKQYDRDEQGIITKYFYDDKARVSKTVRLAIPGQPGMPALTTTFSYDGENRVLSSKITSGNESLENSKTYDRAGLVLSETIEGLTTTYDYAISDGILIQTTVTLPSGATRIVKNFRDGRPKSITGTAGPSEYYTYSIEDNFEAVTKRIGSIDSPRYIKTVTDWIGRVKESLRPSANGTASIKQTNTYNDLGQLIKTQTASLAPIIYHYDLNGIMTRHGLDIDDDGVLGASDRKHSFSYGYVSEDDAIWDYSETRAYPDDAPTDGIIQTRTWTRMTNFSAIQTIQGVTGTPIAETIAKDANGNRSVSRVFLDRNTGKTSTVSFAPFASQPAITVSLAGQMISQINSAGVMIAYQYDALMRPTKVIDRTSTDYSGNNVTYHPNSSRIKTVIDNLGVVQHTYTYDDAGRLVTDETPRVDSSTGQSNGTNFTHYEYNVRNQPLRIWGDVPYPVSYEYDDLGQRIAQYTFRATLADGDKTVFNYHPATGLLLAKTHVCTEPDKPNQTTTYTYTALGQLHTRTWARGIGTTYTYYEKTGALKKADYVDDTQDIEYTYDRLGRIKTVVDVTGTRSFVYRDIGEGSPHDLKPAEEILGNLYGNRRLTNQYESTTGRFIGLQVKNADAAISPLEYNIAYTYDPASARLLTISSAAAGTFTYGYLTNSNLINSVRSGNWHQERRYEPKRNLLARFATSHDGETDNPIVAAYDYTNDTLGRRFRIVHGGQLYKPYMSVGQSMGTFYGYNDRNELTSAQTTVNDDVLPGRDFGYSFDYIGNRMNEKIDGVSHAYTANELNQYVERATPWWISVSGMANRPSGAKIEVNGSELPDNAWQRWYFYKAEPKDNPSIASLQSITLTGIPNDGESETHTLLSMARPVTEPFVHDLDGNLIDDSLWHYEYDGENRLTSMYSKIPDRTGVSVALRFGYDYLGRRIRKEVHDYDGNWNNPILQNHRSTIVYLYHGWTLLAEYSAPAFGTTASDISLIRRYVWGPDLSGTMEGAGTIGGLLAIEDLRTDTQGVYHPAFDGNGNLMALTRTDTGEMVAEYEYDPFGNSLRASGSYAKENPMRFSGKYYDNETGLTYSGFRYYSASLGRFINRDPLEERGGWNLYSGLNYGAANPYAGASGVEGTSWSTEWEQAQDRLLENTSLPHTTQSVTFDGKRNSGLPGAAELNQKTYSANATGHYAQGGAPGTGPQPPSMSVGNPAAGNADINLYIYAGNNPINASDPLGLSLWSSIKRFFSGVGFGIAEVNDLTGTTGSRLDNTLNVAEARLSGSATAGRIVGNLVATVQGGIEMNIGGAMMATGAAECGVGVVGGVITSPTGAGAVAGAGVTAAGAAKIGAGAVVTAHGAVVTARGTMSAITNIKNAVSSSNIKSASRTPSPDNYRGRYNAQRQAEGKSKLPDDHDAHHRIPQEYQGHSDFKGFDFHAPDNIQGIKGSRADVNIHQNVTNDWARFRQENPNASGDQIRDFATQMDVKYQQHWLK